MLAAFYLPEAAAAAAAAGSTAPPISSSSFIATLPEPASRCGLMQRGVAGYRPKVRRHPRGGLGVDIFTRICQGAAFLHRCRSNQFAGTGSVGHD